MQKETLQCTNVSLRQEFCQTHDFAQHLGPGAPQAVVRATGDAGVTLVPFPRPMGLFERGPAGPRVILSLRANQAEAERQS